MLPRVDGLKIAVVNHVQSHGDDRFNQMSDASKLLIEWLRFLIQFENTGTAVALLEGARAAIVEATACCVLGLARPALFSIRAQIDMVLSWTFFKDHAVEWALVEASGDGFKMKKDLFRYFADHNERFNARFDILCKATTRRISDPYRFLSAHVHSQNTAVIPQYPDLSSVVSDVTAAQCPEIQENVGEYIGDVLLSLFANKWTSLPTIIIAASQQRMDAKQQSKFFG